MAEMGITRRQVLQNSAWLAAGGLLGPGSSWAAAAVADKAALADEAFIWGVPLVLTGRYRDIAARAGLPFNQFSLSPDLATPKTRALGPNVDTLYGLGWLDLAAAPQVIEVPDTQDRYYSIQLLDAYGNAFAYIGRRATGTKAGAYALTPPGFSGAIPSGVKQIQAPTSLVLAFVRTLVRGPADLAAARAVHGAYTLGPLAQYPLKRQAGVFKSESLNVIPVVDLGSSGPGYFDELSTLAAAYPPLDFDTPNLARFTALGLVPGKPLPADAASKQLLSAAVPDGLAQVKKLDTSWTVNGWRTKLNVTNIIRNPLERAANNIYGPGTHVAEEALYFTARQGPDGKPLNGGNRYRLRFPAGQTPPAEAFWSVGLYGKDFFLYDNAIDRYSITDRTPGLRLDSEGTLSIPIQHEAPAADTSNWLPTPADEFVITVRIYQPKAAVLSKEYKLPGLEVVSA